MLDQLKLYSYIFDKFYNAYCDFLRPILRFLPHVYTLFFDFSTPDAPVPDGGVAATQPTETSDLDSSDADDSSDEASSFSDSD